ncbi:MAG: GH20, partial [uncultured Gemmatimonadaceae bacterium]
GAGGGGAVRVVLLRAATAAGRAALARAGASIDSAMRAEGYVLLADGGRVEVVAASAAGLFYGVQTLKQLVVGDSARARLAGARIRDWPAMRYRGVHDDVSRGPLPTLEFQKKQLRTLAAYKLNVYSPYLETALAYRSHPLVASPGGALTAAEARELVAYGRRYHVEVIPEQQTFGHMHQLLRLEKYAPLGETPHGHALAPSQPGSLALIRDLYAEVDSAFPGRFLHIGMDETFELGRGQSASRVAREGLGPVYLGFMAQVAELLRPLDRRLLFWGDVAMNHPELVGTLPKTMIAVPWSYDTATTYDKFVLPFSNAGMETWVAPGVSNWWRVYPNYNIALPNIRNFARDAQRLGSTGILTATWDDFGEQLFAQTWTGVLFGAAAGWQPGESSIEEFLAAYPRTFHGDSSAHLRTAEARLMAAQALIASAGLGQNTEYLFWLDPWSPDGQLTSRRLLPIARELRLHAEAAIEELAAARLAGATREPDALDAIELGARRLDLIGLKFQFADETVRLYDRAYAASRDSARRATLQWYDLADITGINGRLQDLRDVYTLNRELYERAWLRENRPFWLQNVLARYDLATQLWLGRADQMTRARQQWARARTLPAAAEIGFPTPPRDSVAPAARPAR